MELANSTAAPATAGGDSRYRMSGDEGVGQFEPADIGPADFPRVDADLRAWLAGVPGLTAMVSDILDENGWRLSVPASTLPPRHRTRRTVVGHAQTLRYLPSRHHLLHPGYDREPPQLAHRVVLRSAAPGDVMVVDASAAPGISVMGGIAAAAVLRGGLPAVVVDGAVRDVEELEDSGLALWTRDVTPASGKHRLDAVSVNRPITCGGVQVNPGDLVVADHSGICFVPLSAIEGVLARVRQLRGES